MITKPSRRPPYFCPFRLFAGQQSDLGGNSPAMDTFMDQLSKLPCKTPVEILHHLIESKVDHLVTIYTQEGFSFTGSGASAQTLKAGKQVVIFRIAEQGRNFYSNNVIYIPAEQISHLQIHDADKILNVLSFGAIPADLPRT